jgi:hypothetical protein
MEDIQTVEFEDELCKVVLIHEPISRPRVLELRLTTPNVTRDYVPRVPEGWTPIYDHFAGVDTNIKTICTGREDYVTATVFIAKFLHELGHVHDFDKMTPEQQSEIARQSRDYGNIGICRPPKDILDVLDVERRAWDWAIAELESICIKASNNDEIQWFVLESSLATYARAFVSDFMLDKVLTKDKESFRERIIAEQNSWVRKHFPLVDYDLRRGIEGNKHVAYRTCDPKPWNWREESQEKDLQEAN